MAVLLKCGAIFLHIPKTGGNWVTEVLENNDLVFAHIGGRHAGNDNFRDFEKQFRLPYRYSRPNKPFFRFCFVRHPLAWYESWFKMQTNLGWPNWGLELDYWNPSAMLDGLGAPNFDGFIRNVLDRRPGFLTEMYGWYTCRDVHFIGRQETLADDLISVLHVLGVTFDEERMRHHEPVNISDKTPLRWQPELQEEIERTEYAVFRRFGYKPELSVPSSASAGPSGLGFIPGFGEDVPLRGPFAKEAGHAWLADIPQFARLADDPMDPYRSALVLLENGRVLPHRHAAHDDIRGKGEGRYSHWRNYLLFSASDNSDPNANGRDYRIRFRPDFGSRDDRMMTEPHPSEG